MLLNTLCPQPLTLYASPVLLPPVSPRRAAGRRGMASEYEQDGEAAQRIAAVIPYYPFKGIPRFYDIGGFLQRPDIFQEVEEDKWPAGV